MPDYITWLRSHIGHRKTILVYTTALIHDEADRVLFQRRSDFREAWWGLPGGVLEIGESFTACVQREAYEETGYAVEPTKLIGLYGSPEWDVRYPNGDEVQQFTVALECRIVGGRSRPDGDETIVNEFFALDGLPDQIPPWYAAMVRDLKCPSNGAYFDPPIVADSTNSYMLDLRERVGRARIIIAGAGAIIQDERGRVLLGLRGDNHLWGMPAGQMELGESPAGTVVRETYEEVGLHIRPTQLVGVFTGQDSLHTYPDGNQVQIAGARFRAEVIGGELKADGVETLDVGWFDLDRLPPMVPRHQRALQTALEHPEGGQFQ
jgi:ADP-ribose pyrophosphatase YjhB (NUDIX family)